MKSRKRRRRTTVPARRRRLSGLSGMSKARRTYRRARAVAGAEIDTVLGTIAVSVLDDMIFGKRVTDSKGTSKIEGGIIPGISRDDLVLKNLVLYGISRFGKRFIPQLGLIQTPALTLAAYHAGKKIGGELGISALLNGDDVRYEGDQEQQSLVQDQDGKLYEVLPDGNLLAIAGDESLGQDEDTISLNYI